MSTLLDLTVRLLPLLAFAGFLFWWLRRRAAGTLRASRRRIVILERTAIGRTSQLLCVRADGRDLLLGATPSSVQILAELDGRASYDPTPPGLTEDGPDEAADDDDGAGPEAESGAAAAAAAEADAEGRGASGRFGQMLQMLGEGSAVPRSLTERLGRT